MLKQFINTLKIFKRSPFLLFVSIPGLAIGLTAFLLLALYINHETSFDKHFTTKDRVVRLYNESFEEHGSTVYPICIRAACKEIPPQVPEVEKATQLYGGWANRVEYKEDRFENQKLLFADAEFFDVFGLNLIEGIKEDALNQKNTVVISESLAGKIFGDKKCLGEIVRIWDMDFTITGIVKDLPNTTHFNFDVLASLKTIEHFFGSGLELYTYFLLKENADINAAGEKIAALNDKLLDEVHNTYPGKSKSGVELLADLHLKSITDFDLSDQANITHIYILNFLAFFILLIAVANHVNLFILHGEKRSLEIGLRKSLGADKASLRTLLFFETALITVVAFILALILTKATIPYFGDLIHKSLSFSEIMNPVSILLIIGFLIFLVLLSGAYPAMYLSKLGAIQALKGGTQKIQRKKWLSISSVVIQFSISAFLIVCMLAINAQVKFMKNMPVGFSLENVIGVNGFDQKIMGNFKPVQRELAKLPFVKNAGASLHYMGGGSSGQYIRMFGEPETEDKDVNQYRVQSGFCETMELDLIEGRFFRDNEEDKKGVILNQATVKMLGLEDPIGKQVMAWKYPLEIIGVVKDFYYEGYAGEPIAPLVLTMYSNEMNLIYLKLNEPLTQTQQDQITAVINKFDPDYKFHSYELKNSYERKFVSEDQLTKLVFFGTLFAIFLSFIGMFALSVFNVEKRTKEIGIRKAVGSSVSEVMIFLLKDVLKWVLMAMIPAFLVAYILLGDWLNGFANRIELGVIYFILAGLLGILIAILAISYQSYRAAIMNPVKSLKYE